MDTTLHNFLQPSSALDDVEELKHQERARFATMYVLPLLPPELHPYCDCDSAEYQVRVTLPGHAEFIVYSPAQGKEHLTFYAAGSPWADLPSALQAAREQAITFAQIAN